MFILKVVQPPRKKSHKAYLPFPISTYQFNHTILSANNQTLIKEHKGKFYVFTNVNAESWHDEGEENELTLIEAHGEYDTRDEAFEEALEMDRLEGSEYGVQFNRLCKDDSEVKLI